MSKQTIDVSQLSGWSGLSEGTQAVTVKTIVNGVENSASSNVVTVEKTLTKQTKEVSLLMVEGDQTILPDANMTMEKAIVKKPATLIPSNIKQGVSIGGVVGELITTGKEEVEVSEALDMSNGNQIIPPPDNTKTISKVTIIKPDTFIAQNIKNGVEIGGITGTYTPEIQTQEKTVTITENGTVNIMPDSGKTLSKVTALVNVPTSSGGAELNIHYGDTAPEDTSKLWVKTTKPESVEISPDFGYGEAVQTTGVKSGFPTSAVTCEDGDYLYVAVSSTVKKYNKKTLEFVSNVVALSRSVINMVIFEGGLYYTASYYHSYGNSEWRDANLYYVDLNTKEETLLLQYVEHLGCSLIIYNNKVYLISGGSESSSQSISGYWTHTYPINNRITVYDISLKTQETISYSYGCWYNKCCLIGNNVFVFGGYNREANSAKSNIIKVNLDTKTVTKCNAVLPIATYNMGVSNIGNYVYLSGGNKTSQIVYRYDTVNDTIEQVNVTLEHARATCATFFNGTELYLLGSNAIVDKLQIDVPLSSTKLKIISDWLNNQFAVINSNSARVMIGVNKAFKGDENNKAKEVTAYVYDGVNWHNLNGEITFTKLYAPKISISGKTLTITNDGRNGAYATNYTIYNGNTALTTIRDTTLDLTTVITTNGTYNISAIALGIGYTDSDRSNIVEYNYAVYNITTNLTGVTANASNPTTVSTLASSTLTFTASTGYNLPDNVTVTGAEFTWTKSSGTLVLSNPTGAVSVTIAGVAISRTITATLTNVTAASGNATTIATDETKTLTYTAADGYVLPDTVTVTGATGVWNKDEGTLILSNPTANVTFTIAGVEAAASGYNVTFAGVTNSVMGNHDYSLIYAYDGQDKNGTSTDITNGATVSCSSGYIYVEGYVYDSGLDSEPTVTGGVVVESSGVTDYKAWILFKVTGNGTVSTISFNCFIEGTQITLADGSTKAIEDITYDDELLVWNFYDGKFDTAKPTWIKVEETAPRYNLVKFSDGREFGTVGSGGEKGYHRVFNKEAGAFTHIGTNATPIGTTTFADDGTNPTIVSEEIIEKPVKYYNIITDKHYNIFANGILTSCRLSNKYHIEDMKYIGEPVIHEQEEKEYRERLEKNRKWLG